MPPRSVVGLTLGDSDVQGQRGKRRQQETDAATRLQAVHRGSVARRPGALREQLELTSGGANQLGAAHAVLEGGDKAAWRDGRRHGEAIEEEDIRRLHASLVKGHLLSAHGMKTLRKAAETASEPSAAWPTPEVASQGSNPGVADPGLAGMPQWARRPGRSGSATHTLAPCLGQPQRAAINEPASYAAGGGVVPEASDEL